MLSRALHVLILTATLIGCTIDGNIEDLSISNRLNLVLDNTNQSVNSANIRSYEVKGQCFHIDQPVTVSITGKGEYSTTCLADNTFSFTVDLEGASEGELAVSAQQTETDAKKTSADSKKIIVDLSPPTVTVNTPDSANNYAASSLKANYPLTGTCSDSFNLVRLTTSLQEEYFAVCTAGNVWEQRLNLSAQTAPSLDFYVQHFDAAGNISETKVVTIRNPQWQKVSSAVTSPGISSVRQIIQYGTTGRILLAAPLRNDDLVDLGMVNYDDTGLMRISPISGQWGLDTNFAITPVPKHGRALYGRATMGRVQLRELHSIKTDGSGDKVLIGPTTANPVGGVTKFTLTPNENTVIAIADLETTDNEFNLYAVDVLTAARTKLNGTMVNGGDVRDYKLSPDGATVIFRMDKEIDESIDLYAVSVNGTSLRRLNVAMTGGNQVTSDYEISPDNKWVVFRDNQSFTHSSGGTGIGLASLVTGEVINLTGTTFTGFTVPGLFSPNSRYVAIRADRAISTCLELLVYDIQLRSEASVATPCTSSSTDIASFSWSHDSSRIAYTQVLAGSRFDLYTVKPDATSRLQLTTAAATRNGLYQGYKTKSLLYTADDSRLVFQADFTGVAAATAADMKFDIYSVKSDGTQTPIKLSNLSVASVIRDFPILELSPQGDRVVFVGDIEVNGKYEMYLAAVDGSSDRKLNLPIANSEGDVLTNSSTYFFDWPRDKVGFLADDGTDLVNIFYLASLALPPSAPTQIGMDSVITGDFLQVIASGNKSKVVLRGNPVSDEFMHLWVADADGSNFHRVTKDYPVGAGKVLSQALTNDGSKVIYIADQDTAGVHELYVVDSTSGVPVKISAAITNPTGGIQSFKFNEATQKVFYYGDLTSETSPEIHVVNLDGTGHVKITPNYAWTVAITNWEVAPNGAYIVLRWDYHTDEKYEIDKWAADGSGSAVPINTAILASGDALGFKISNDSSWICYWGETSVSKRIDVKVASAATPAATNYVVLNGTDTTRGASNCIFSDDSEYVIAAGDWVTEAKTVVKSFRLSDQTLFALNPSLPATSNTSLYLYLQEGANKRLITLSESAPEIYEIYSMNLDGTDTKKISVTPYSGGQVNANNLAAVRIVDDADKTIVYTGLIETLGKWDLFAVKWDGSNSRKLVTLNAHADIYDTFYAPGIDRVFFRADQEKDGVLGLYSIKTDGTGLKNHTPGLVGATGAWYEPAFTSSRVFFTSDAYNSQVLELFADTY